MHYALESPMSEPTVRAILAKQLGRRDNIQDNPGLRREKIVLELDADFGDFYLDSPNAVIEMPKNIPSDIKCAYNRMISITRPSDSEEVTTLAFEFMIIHNEDALDFSISHGNIRTTKSVSCFKIQIGNWWEEVDEEVNEEVDDTRHARPRHKMVVFTGVELGETVRRTSAKSRIAYPLRS